MRPFGLALIFSKEKKKKEKKQRIWAHRTYPIPLYEHNMVAAAVVVAVL